MGPQIQMKVFRDRIELWNYGRLPEEITIEKLLGRHSSNARNKNIANVFYKAGFIEAWGRGISKIVSQFAKAGLEAPVFEDFCGGVLVTLYRNTNLVEETIAHNSNSNNDCTKAAQRLHKDLHDAAIRTFDCIKDNPKYTVEQLAGKLSISKRSVLAHIALLKQNGLIRRSGGKTFGHWIITENEDNVNFEN